MNFQPRPHLTTADRRPPFDCIALLLQGGGALGAYQGGVYEALAEADIHPDWIAGISIDGNGHIVSGYTKLNDSYFSQAYYNTTAWKQSVTCQELGHNVGLDHQDEDFNNAPLYSCMDYQAPPYQYPNGHDYEELEAIYAHTDSYNSYTGGGGGGGGCAGGGGGGGSSYGPAGAVFSPNGWRGLAQVIITYTASPDANGDGTVTSTDALCILRQLGGFAATTNCPNPLPFGDVNECGAVDSVDALCVLRYLGGFARNANCPYDPVA